MPVREPDGSILWHGTIVDVTERRLLDQSLAENTSRLQLALATARIGVWEWNIATNAVFWSPECFTINGLSEFDNTLDSFVKLCIPTTWTRSLRECKPPSTAIPSTPRSSAPFGPTASALWVTNLGRVKYDERGQPVRMLGTIHDISELKRSAEACRAKRISFAGDA